MFRALVLTVAALAAATPAAFAQTGREIAFYECENRQEINVRYLDKPKPERAMIVLDGVVYTLGIDTSASGARYTSLKTDTPSEGLQWWVKGKEATLARLVMNEDKTRGSFQPVTTCKLTR